MQEEQLLANWKVCKKLWTRLIQSAQKYYLLGQNLDHKHTRQEFLLIYSTVYGLCTINQRNYLEVVFNGFKEAICDALAMFLQGLHQTKGIAKIEYFVKVWAAFSGTLRRLNRPHYLAFFIDYDLELLGIKEFLNSTMGSESCNDFQEIFFQQLTKVTLFDPKIRRGRDFTNSRPLREFVQALQNIRARQTSKKDKKPSQIFDQMITIYKAKTKDYLHFKNDVLRKFSPSQFIMNVNQICQLEKQISNRIFMDVGFELVRDLIAQQLMLPYSKQLLSYKDENGMVQFAHDDQFFTVLRQLLQTYIQLGLKTTDLQDVLEERVYFQVSSLIKTEASHFLKRKSLVNYCNFMETLANFIRQLMDRISINLLQEGDFIKYFKGASQKALRLAELPVDIEQLLACYVDFKLRPAIAQREQFQALIVKLVIIFQLILNKDGFMLRYKRKLCRRALTLSPEAIRQHQSFITVLRQNCDIKTTESLQMFIYEIAKAERNNRDLQKILGQCMVTLSVNLRMFSLGIWPTKNLINLPLKILPKQIAQAERALKIYAEQIQDGKQIKISYSQSTIRWGFFINQIQYFIQTNCLQGAILWLVHKNRPGCIKFKQIAALMPDVDEELIVLSLRKIINSAEPIIIKRKEQEDECFLFNEELQPANRVIVYDYPVGLKEEEDTSQGMRQNRQMILDALVTKLLKIRKVAQLNDILQEIPKLVKVFRPESLEIKKAIERLITKEILKRCTENRNKFLYTN